MFVGNKNLAKFIDNLKTLTITNKYGHVITICNETLSEISDSLRRGYKFECMWMDLQSKLKKFRLAEDRNWTYTENEMRLLYEKYFPKPRKVVEDTPFMKGFVRGVELSERIVRMRKMIEEIKGVLDGK